MQSLSQSEGASTSDVLIVGAGPTGLILANDLLSRGVKFKIIDKAAAASPYSRALVVHARTLEHLGNLGFADSFIDNGLALRAANVYSANKRIVHINFDEIDSPYKFVLSIPQNKTESLLADNLACAEVNIERNCEFLSFTQDDENVTVRLRRTTESGTSEEYTHQCKYLIGCDGAHSAVRAACGINFEGATYADTFGLADVAFKSKLTEDEMHAFFSEQGAAILIPYGNGRCRFIFEAEDAAKINRDDKLELQTVADVVAKRCGKDIEISDPVWLSWFKIHRRCAETYQKGRVFLAGDAGHIHSPVGGVGMNTGMQDALNLGWKIGLACRGLASEGLLASYNEERHAVGMAVLAGTDLATKVVTLKSPVAKAARDSLMTFMAAQEVVQHRIVKTGSLTGVNYRDMSLSAESHEPQTQSIARSLFPLPFKKATSELPTIGSWMDFTDAPRAGDFAPDAELDDNGFRLSYHIGSPRFKLLLFDGYDSSEEGYKHLYDLEYRVASKFCDWIDIYMVAPFLEGAKQLPNFAAIIFDDQKYLHEYYGASAECLYLIRPDGYVGFRCQPASYEKLEDYLLKVFRSDLVRRRPINA